MRDCFVNSDTDSIQDQEEQKEDRRLDARRAEERSRRVKKENKKHDEEMAKMRRMRHAERKDYVLDMGYEFGCDLRECEKEWEEMERRCVLTRGNLAQLQLEYDTRQREAIMQSGQPGDEEEHNGKVRRRVLGFFARNERGGGTVYYGVSGLGAAGWYRGRAGREAERSDEWARGVCGEE